MNNWRKIAEMIEVEMNKDFKIKGNEKIYKITNIGLITESEIYGEDSWSSQPDILYDLLGGILEIDRWPEVGDYIYYPDPARDSFINSVEHFEGSITTKRLQGSVGIYKTVEGAREKARELGWID